MGWGEGAGPRRTGYDRATLVQVLIYHQARSTGLHPGSCQCGWGQRPEELGLSHADHVADVYEDAALMKSL